MHSVLNWWGLGSVYQEQPAIGWTLITFFVFVAIIRHFVKQPLQNYLHKRSESIQTAIEEAQQARIHAQEHLQTYERRLLELDEEVSRLKTDFEHQGQLERARLQTEAEKIAEQMQKDSEQTLKSEVAHALLKLKQEITQKILLQTQKNLNLVSESDWRLCTNFVRQL